MEQLKKRFCVDCKHIDYAHNHCESHCKVSTIINPVDGKTYLKKCKVINFEGFCGKFEQKEK